MNAGMQNAPVGLISVVEYDVRFGSMSVVTLWSFTERVAGSISKGNVSLRKTETYANCLGYLEDGRVCAAGYSGPEEGINHCEGCESCLADLQREERAWAESDAREDFYNDCM